MNLEVAVADTVMKDPVLYLPSNYIFASTIRPEPVLFATPSIA